MRLSLFALVCCLAGGQPGRANVVSDWIEAAEAIRVETRGTPEGRGLGKFVPTEVALPICEAINAIGNAKTREKSIDHWLDVLNAAYASAGFAFELESIEVIANDTWFNAGIGSVDEAAMKAPVDA